MLAALDIAIREGSDVICMPMGSIESSEVEQIAYRNASELGVVVVCPAGNDHSYQPIYPAAYPECISVRAIDKQNHLAPFSNFGEWVTTTAPGVHLPVAVGEKGYDKWSGTSFSCGILAGIIALMIKVNSELTPEQIKKILIGTGQPILGAVDQEFVDHLRIVDAWEAVHKANESNSVKGKNYRLSGKKN